VAVSYDRNVFVNCPFDGHFLPLLRPLLFTVIYLDLNPRIALERTDSGESRLEKTVQLIRESKYSIHDLSRSEAIEAGELYRLNMPFELGLDYGCRLFGAAKFREKVALVLESKPHRYKAAISDLSGADIECHFDEPYKVIGIVRNWLKSACLPAAVGPARIGAAFTQFMAEDYNALTSEGFSAADIAALPIGELIERMRLWASQRHS
jgi:hypothetical protein